MIQRRVLGLLLAAVSCSAFAPRPAQAGVWVADGAPLAPTDSLQIMPAIAADGAGGAYVAWQEVRNGWGIYAKRLMPDGTTAPGWPSTGRLVAAGFVDPVIVADGNRGAYIAGPNAYARAEGCWYVSSGGAVSPSALTGGAAASSNAGPAAIEKTDPTGLPSLLPAGDAGAYLAWSQGGHLNSEILLRRLTPTGIDPGWPGDVGIAAAESRRRHRPEVHPWRTSGPTWRIHTLTAKGGSGQRWTRTAQREGETGMGVEVDQAARRSSAGHGIEIERGRGLRYAVFLIGDRDDAGHVLVLAHAGTIVRLKEWRPGIA